MTSADLVPMVLTGIALVVIELLRSIPAWQRVRRARSTDGVSPISIGVLAGTGPGWIVVAVLAQSPAAAIATGLWLVFHVLLLVEVVRVSRELTRTVVVATVVSLLGMIAAALIGLWLGDVATALGVAIGISSAAYSLPALFSGMTSPSTAGLSLISLSTNSAEGAIYFVAGLGLGGIAPSGILVPAYLLFGGLALLSNVPRLARTAWRRAARKDDVAAATAPTTEVEGF